MSKLEIRNLNRSFDGVPVLKDLTLDVAEGEFVSILGPSGSGKSTTFSVLTGALPPTSGEVRVDGVPLAERPGRFAYMPQKDALLPWRRVLDNLTLGLEVAGVRRKEARRKVEPLLDVFGLTGYERSYPAQLSGGMRQRAALLRTVVQDREVLLLDEPFGALDALTRARMQQWIERVWEEYRWTVLLITHDVREAVFLSDRVYVFSPRPATVVKCVEVGLPRPRTLASYTDPAFTRIEAELLETLLEEER
ncbi:ABC transporter ATP-binding protein [Actinocorallia sp. API 0066]|uniref:ABC transporter ATP-binding protein n=1 Tax=Actinocorallia sp. API 0066 TaxID=2896846 RepID=UPI001E60EA89|nr:ABC transporter ATP-binding protein [Actinocorallia sp. API 0066]MCD0449476.1 ABC transporter ATP-binding protein [Actinocorallia sp. API 0066]